MIQEGNSNNSFFSILSIFKQFVGSGMIWVAHLLSLQGTNLQLFESKNIFNSILIVNFFDPSDGFLFDDIMTYFGSI